MLDIQLIGHNMYIVSVLQDRTDNKYTVLLEPCKGVWEKARREGEGEGEGEGESESEGEGEGEGEGDDAG
jgi:hypothetical protein